MILVRHAQSAANAVYHATGKDPDIVDPEITELGRMQVELAARRLSKLGVRRLVASPMRRALKTAELIASRIGNVPIVVEPLLAERASMPWEIGSPRSQLQAAFPKLSLDHLSEVWWPKPVESESDLRSRCAIFFEQAWFAGGADETAAITHWGVIRALTGKEVPNCAVLPSAEELLFPSRLRSVSFLEQAARPTLLGVQASPNDLSVPTGKTDSDV
jgi:broad specificity phosphatase PhoE